MAEPNPEELFDRGEDILNFALNGGGGTFRPDSLEAKEYYIQAKEYFEKACELNYAKGCVNLGSLYQGEGLVIGEKNPRLKERLKKAVQYYSKACDLKDGEGCFLLGYIYELNGYGVVKKDLKKAIQYYVKACELDYDGGCLVLLTRDELANKQEIFQYYSKACDLNDKFVCSWLGAMQYQGKVVVKNEKQAMKKFEKACKLGFKEVCEMVTYKGLCELGY
ncbi:hypothetical protein HpKG25_06910 [Helicobacter pylori]